MSKLANLVAAYGLFAASFSTTYSPSQMSLTGALLLGPDCATLHRQPEVQTVHHSAGRSQASHGLVIVCGLHWNKLAAFVDLAIKRYEICV